MTLIMNQCRLHQTIRLHSLEINFKKQKNFSLSGLSQVSCHSSFYYIYTLQITNESK